MKIAGALLACALLASAVRAEAIVHLKLDEGEGDTARDSSGKDHHGTITGARWVEHDGGKALEFKGPDYEGPFKPPGTFVRLEGTEGLDPSGTVTVAARIYPTFKPVAWGGIVEKGVGYGSSYRLMMLRNGRLRASVGNQHPTVDSPEPLELDRWTEVKMAFDGETLQLFVDGEKVAAESVEPGPLTSGDPIEIGRRFTGKIDDVVIGYDK